SFPKSGDDAACMIVACGALSNECRMYADLTAARCVSIGVCAAANDPGTCTQVTNAPDGTSCMGGTGMCQGGVCQSAVDMSMQSGGGHSGCELGGTAPAGALWLLALLALAL